MLTTSRTRDGGALISMLLWIIVETTDTIIWAHNGLDYYKDDRSNVVGEHCRAALVIGKSAAARDKMLSTFSFNAPGSKYASQDIGN